LEAVRGKALFYPAAGSDYNEALKVFQDHIDTFWFCDKAYPAGLNLPPVLTSNDGFLLIQSQKSGAPNATCEIRLANGRTYRFLEPSKLIEAYERTDGRQLTVIRRRGFGQIALSTEFTERALGVFMHRGDSPGESGSNIYFLSNKKADYEPCGRLFEKIGHCLADQALIISDGSNTSIRGLRRFHERKQRDTRGSEAFSYHQGRNFTFGGFVWTCVGWLSAKNGPTLVWGVTRRAELPKVAASP
jgi:hypothetical protein